MALIYPDGHPKDRPWEVTVGPDGKKVWHIDTSGWPSDMVSEYIKQIIKEMDEQEQLLAQLL